MGTLNTVNTASNKRIPIIVRPFEGGRIAIFPIPYSPRFAVAIGTEGVVIEGEDFYVCIEVYVGFGSGGHKGKGLCRW